MLRPRTSRFLILCFILAAIAAFSFAQSVSSPTLSQFASRQFGQSLNAGPLSQPLVSTAPNLVEGREFNQPYSIAFDNTNPSAPILYVADTLNSRVLGFKNPSRLTACGIKVANCGFADLVIGQNSMYATIASGGARNNNTSGLAFPTSVAVDASGNLYVADSGNNRIMRFPPPFNQPTFPVQPDLVIGQSGFSRSNANQGNSNPSNTSLNLNGFPSGIAIDPQGNLWVADAGNNRVLRFPGSGLTQGANLPTADVVIGQSAFNVGTFVNNTGQPTQLVKNILAEPVSVAFDAQGRLYVSDILDRVLYFGGNFSTGMSAQRVLGVYEGGVNPIGLPAINQYQLGQPPANSYTSVFTNGTNLFVLDSANNRIVEYDTPEKWLPPPQQGQSPQIVQDSPPMIAFFGQTDFNSGKPNQGNAEASNATFGFKGGPATAAFLGTSMWVSDSGNNRVLGIPQTNGTYSLATQLAGQVDFPYSQPNLIEGRELFIAATLNGGLVPGGGMAVDLSPGAGAPHLYIADTFNNRILGFKDARNVQPGQKADLVIGQTDLTGQPGSAFYRALINNPFNDSTRPGNQGLSLPSGVAVDAQGNLWVADTGNGRVLRFPTPFAFSLGTPILPNLVLGQQSFNISIPSVSQNGMTDPFGLAFFSDGSVAVSEPQINRILIFKKPASGDFTNFQAASFVLGQAGFSNSTASKAAAGLSLPFQLGVDSSDRLYVADAGNTRMSVFTSPQFTNENAGFTLNTGFQPVGVAVSGSNQTNAGIGQGTGEIFLTFSNGTVWKLFELDALQGLNLNAQNPYEQTIQLQAGALAAALDSSSNLIVSDVSNRMVFYYPQLGFQHGATFSSTFIAPGQFTYLTRAGLPFSFTNDFVAASYPWPTVANDLKVNVAGTDAHIFSVINEGPYIAFQMPTNAPSSGTADIVVSHASTGEIVGVLSAPVSPYNPGFFTIDQSGNGQVAALNGVDKTENSVNNPVSHTGNQTIMFCLTGGGVFDGGGDAPPADGMPYTGTTGAKTHITPQLINTTFGANALAPSNLVVYSGAGLPGQGCNFPGGWQITWTIDPKVAPPPNPPNQRVSVQMNSIAPIGVVTYFSVK